MDIGLMFSGGIPYLEKDDDIRATWTIHNTVEMTWRGIRFGVPLCFKKTYELRKHLFDSGKEQLYNMFFEEINYDLKVMSNQTYLRSSYVVPPDRIKADLATLNETLTKQGLHQLDRLLTNGGEYEKPWIFKDCGDVDCIHTIATHTTAVGIEPIRNPDGCSD